MGDRAETAAFALGCRVGSLQGPLMGINSMCMSLQSTPMAKTVTVNRCF